MRRRAAGLAALVVGAGVMWASPAQSATGDLRLPAPSGSDALKAGPAGVHKIYPYPIYLNGERPPPLSQDAFAAVVSSADSYWRTATGGTVSVAAGWPMPQFWSKIDLTPDQLKTCDREAIKKAVLAKAGTGGQREHLMVILDTVPGCDFTEEHQFGTFPAGGSYSIVNADLDRSIVLRSITRNSGVPWAGSLDCVDNGSAVPLSGNCTENPQNDPWDPASFHPYGQIGTPIADTLNTMGVLSPADYPRVEPGAEQSLTLAPLSATAGRRGFFVDIGRYRYSVDYRIPKALDAWIDDTVWNGPFGKLADPGGGVVVHRQDLSAAPAEQDRLVIDFHPDDAPTDTQRHPGLGAGESYSSPGGLFKLSVTSANAARAVVTVSFPSLGRVERWAGADRYATSATISAKTYPAGVATAYIASGEVFTDALSGAPVAGRDGGPVLLVSPSAVPSPVATELRRLNPKRIVILGGPATVSDAVMTALDAYTTGVVDRWWGQDRFGTSAVISNKSYQPEVETAYVASGRVFPDALSGAPVAGKTGGPVLLVDTIRVPGAVAKELERLKPGKIVILGGPASVTEGTRAELMEYTDGRVERWWGDDRYSTSAQIVSNGYPDSGGTVYIASGKVYTDALSGAPVAGTHGAPLLLVDSERIPDTVAAELERLQPDRIVIFGGAATVSEQVKADLAQYISS